jgi:hypothetical protein
MIIAIFPSGMDSIVYIQQFFRARARNTQRVDDRADDVAPSSCDADRDDSAPHLQGAVARG